MQKSRTSKIDKWLQKEKEVIRVTKLQIETGKEDREGEEKM